jgi:hypothetical protein
MQQPAGLPRFSDAHAAELLELALDPPRSKAHSAPAATHREPQGGIGFWCNVYRFRPEVVPGFDPDLPYAEHDTLHFARVPVEGDELRIPAQPNGSDGDTLATVVRVILCPLDNSCDERAADVFVRDRQDADGEAQ